MKLQIGRGVCAMGFLLLFVAARAVAQSWSLTQCDPAGAPGWERFERAMHAAKPGSTIYVPVPFPTTPEQVLKDYLSQYTSVMKGMKNPEIRQREARVLDDLASGKYTYKLQRVENWTVSRCHQDQKRDFYQLLSIFETDGVEVTRAVINDSGLMTTWNSLPASVPGPVPGPSRTLPEPSVAMAQLNGSLDIQGESPEYVVSGGTLDCFLTHPCLAFRRAELTYVAWGDLLFEVSATSPQLIQGKDVFPGEGPLNTLGATERLVSLGGKVFTIARQVDPSTVRKGVSAFAR